MGIAKPIGEELSRREARGQKGEMMVREVGSGNGGEKHPSRASTDTRAA